MKLFDVDGPLMAALNKLADLVFANLLFILFSLPVVTLGASLTALQTVVLALAEDEENLVVRKRFWQAFRRDFKQSTLLWGIFAAAALILMGSNAAAQSMGGSLGRFYAVFLGALGILLAMAFLMALPLQSRYPAPARTKKFPAPEMVRDRASVRFFQFFQRGRPIPAAVRAGAPASWPPTGAGVPPGQVHSCRSGARRRPSRRAASIRSHCR